MTVIEVIMLVIVITLIAFLILSIIYKLYKRKIYKQLENKEKTALYNFIDKKYFKIMLSITIGLSLVLSISIYKKYPRYDYEIEFSQAIMEFNINDLYDEIKQNIKSDNDLVYVYNGLTIFTDKDGQITNVNLSLIINKNGTNKVYLSTYDKEEGKLKFSYNSLTIHEINTNQHFLINDYKEKFLRIDFNNLNKYFGFNQNYFDLEFKFEINEKKNIWGIKNEYQTIIANGDIVVTNQEYLGKQGIFDIRKIRKNLNGNSSTVSLATYYILEGEV